MIEGVLALGITLVTLVLLIGMILWFAGEPGRKTSKEKELQRELEHQKQEAAKALEQRREALNALHQLQASIADHSIVVGRDAHDDIHLEIIRRAFERIGSRELEV